MVNQKRLALHKAIWLIPWLSMCLVSISAIFSHAQDARFHATNGVSATPTATQVALIGPGWGVARIEVPVGQIADDATVRIVVTDRENRILYPASEIFSATPVALPPDPPTPKSGRRVGDGAVIRRLRGAIDRLRQHIEPEEHLRIHFLFTGTAPLSVEIEGDLELSLVVTPRELSTANATGTASNELLEQMLAEWWNGYVQQTARQIARSDYPTLIERYLVNMLGNRFGFPVPDLLKVKSRKRSRQTDPLPTLSLVAGVESLRDEISESMWMEPKSASAPRQQLPRPPRWQDMPLPEIPQDVAIESIAQAVPDDFFYLRFGSFANYLWFQRIGEARGGDLAQLALLRGYNYEASARVERMLNSRMTTISKLFGDTVISDMAIVGYDLYMQEGPSMGVVFEAKNYAVLKASMEQERLATANRMKAEGCTLEIVDIDGQSVSLLSTPDHQVRAFMVEAEPYLFVTTSRSLAQRFLEARRTKETLANNAAFRFARWIMPLENQYDMFAYFSSGFFRNLLSPRYQIELKRRMLAIAAIETAELASAVEAMEASHRFSGDLLRIANKSKPMDRRASQSASTEIDRWISEGYLPSWFQRRADGSETLRFGDAWIDSTRGRRGSFLPIADTPVPDCSIDEAADYATMAQFYVNQWQETDPLMFGLRRFAHPDIPKAERLAIEAYVAPLGSEKYGAFGMLLAPPVPTQVIMPPDDVVNVQVRLAGIQTNQVFSEDHFLFAGLKDLVPPLPEETKGLIAILQLMRTLPAYLGAWPKPGYLDRLPLGLGGGPPDVLGFSRSVLGLWRWQMGGFSVISFNRSIIDSCALHLQVAPAQDYAQGRLKIRDLSKSKVASLFNTLSFRQAAQTTRGNLLLLDSMQQQLGVPPEQAKIRAEQLLDAKLQCTLGGEYLFTDDRWMTTAWPNAIRLAPNTNPSTIGFDSLHTVAPDDYQASWLQWFRGAQIHLTQLPERLVVVGELDMEPLPPPKKEETAPASEESLLPNMNFDLYNLPFQFFQKDKPKSESKPKAEDKGSEQVDAPKSRKKF
jgi:hypothetical protein